VGVVVGVGVGVGVGFGVGEGVGVSVGVSVGVGVGVGEGVGVGLSVGVGVGSPGNGIFFRVRYPPIKAIAAASAPAKYFLRDVLRVDVEWAGAEG